MRCRAGQSAPSFGPHRPVSHSDARKSTWLSAPIVHGGWTYARDAPRHSMLRSYTRSRWPAAGSRPSPNSGVVCCLARIRASSDCADGIDASPARRICGLLLRYRGPMASVHGLLGWASLWMSLVVLAACVWSAITARRSGGREDHRFAVDRSILATLLILTAAGFLGVAQLLGGGRAADALHLVYGPAALMSLPLATAVGARARDGRLSPLRRDLCVAVGAVVLLGLVMRLFATG